MVDYISLGGTVENYYEILQHCIIDPKAIINLNTGEESRSKRINFRGLELTLIEPRHNCYHAQMYLKGSLHKYYNYGKHNHNDFGRKELEEVIEELNDTLGINLESFALRQLEIGVNIEPPIPTEQLLDNIMYHKSKKIKDKEVRRNGIYKVASYSHYEVKIYDKSRQYGLKQEKYPNGLTRFEIKYKKMAILNAREIFTLGDVMDHDWEWMESELLNAFDHLMYYDEQSIPSERLRNLYGNPRFWNRQTKQMYNHHRRKLNAYQRKNPYNMKSRLRALIQDKTRELCDY